MGSITGSNHREGGLAVRWNPIKLALSLVWRPQCSRSPSNLSYSWSEGLSIIEPHWTWHEGLSVIEPHWTWHEGLSVIEPHWTWHEGLSIVEPYPWSEGLSTVDLHWTSPFLVWFCGSGLRPHFDDSVLSKNKQFLCGFRGFIKDLIVPSSVSLSRWWRRVSLWTDPTWPRSLLRHSWPRHKRQKRALWPLTLNTSRRVWLTWVAVLWLGRSSALRGDEKFQIAWCNSISI